jgi:hypothetical protein
MILENSKHELFAQAVARGISPAKAYVSAGYAKGNARSNAARLSANEHVLSRIQELKTAVAQGVVAAEIRRRSWRVLQLQTVVDDLLALRAARRVLYAHHLGEGYAFSVADAAEEAKHVAEGCRPLPAEPGTPAAEPGAPEYPKMMQHPGFPIGGETGLLVKDYRGKKAGQEIWKFDAAWVEKLAHVLKQAAIEEGQWSEKREVSGGVSMAELERRLNAGRDRVAAAKKADAKAAALHVVRP